MNLRVVQSRCESERSARPAGINPNVTPSKSAGGVCTCANIASAGGLSRFAVRERITTPQPKQWRAWTTGPSSTMSRALLADKPAKHNPITLYAFAYVSGRRRIRRSWKRTEHSIAPVFAEAFGMPQNARGAILRPRVVSRRMGTVLGQQPQNA